MELESRDVEEDSLQIAERRFREACARIVKNDARSPRKNLFGNFRRVQKIALRPSMIDRACASKAVVSSTPMIHNKQQPFTPDTSGTVSPINDCSNETVPQNLQPVVSVQRLNLPDIKNGTVISISSTSKEQSVNAPTKNNASANQLPTYTNTNENKSDNLNNVISKLVSNRSVLREMSGNVCNTTNKTVQTSKNSTEPEEKTAGIKNIKKLSRAIFGKTAKTEVRQTQTGISLDGNVSNRRNSVSETVKSDTSDTVASWETPGLLLPNFIDNDHESSSDDGNIAMDVGAPWRAPSGLRETILPVAHSVLPNDDSLEDELDDTFVPKPPNKKKVFTYKKKNIENIVRKVENLNYSLRGKKTEKVELDKKKEIVEKKLIKENVKPVTRSELSSSLMKKKQPNKVPSSNPLLQNGSLTDNNNSLSTTDSSFSLPTENNPQNSVENFNKEGKEKAYIKKAKKNKTLNSVKNQDNSFRKPLRKEQFQRTEQGMVSKDPISDKTDAKVARSKKGKRKNRHLEKEYEDTNLQDQSFSDFEEQRQLEKTKEKVRVDDLVGDIRPSISNSEVTKTKRISCPEKQKHNKRENAEIQTDVPEASLATVLERVITSLCEVGTSRAERCSPRKQTKKNEESNTTDTTKKVQSMDVVNIEGKHNKSKKNLKRCNGIVRDLQADFQSVDSNAVEEISPQEHSYQSQEDSYQRKDVETPLNLNSISEPQKKKDEELNKKSVRKNGTMVQSHVDSKKNKSKKNKKGSSAEVKEISGTSQMDSGIGACSQQSLTFKKPAVIKKLKKVTEQVELAEQLPPVRRSTRERRPTVMKSAGFIVCTSQREYDRVNKHLCGSGVSSVPSRASRSNSSQRRKTNTRRATSVRATTATCSPIPEINNETNFGMVDDLPATSGLNISPATPELNVPPITSGLNIPSATSGLNVSPAEENGEIKNYVFSGRTQKRRTNNKSSKKIVESLNKTFENASHELNDFLNIRDGDKARAIRWCLKDPKYTQVNDMPGVSVCVTNNFSNGLLKIEGGKYKPRQVASRHELSFCVLEGRCEVEVQDECQKFTIHENFIVPPGVEYRIKNINAKKRLLLFFTKIPKSV